jgi:CheY-like chemotaxis protein
MDCQMPEVDGFEATRMIRQNQLTIPIVALTASAIKGDREMCMAAGMNAYCCKPINPRELFATIDSLLVDKSPVSEPVEPPIFVPRLLEQCSKNLTVVNRILEKFEIQASENLKQIQQSIAAQDATTAAKTSHSLKGAAAIIAADRLSKLAGEIEQFGRDGRLDKIAEQLSQLEFEVRSCLDYLPQARASAFMPGQSGVNP